METRMKDIESSLKAEQIEKRYLQEELDRIRVKNMAVQTIQQKKSSSASSGALNQSIIG